eukprot:scaffold68173_cov69-Phaeocystis_antarctica.AAC.3
MDSLSPGRIYGTTSLDTACTVYESRRKRHDQPRLPPPSAVAWCAQRSDQDNQAPGKDRLPERGHFAWRVCDENIGPEVNSENPTAADGDA